LISIIDEDKNGTISISEYYSTLEAYNARGEKNGPFDDDPTNLKFELQALFRMITILRERNISADELFRMADTSGDGKIELEELKICLKGIGGCQEKELHAIRGFLDIDGNGDIDENEFMQQMKKANKMFDSY